MKCLVCGVEYSESDIALMEEGEQPVCDVCMTEIIEEQSDKLH